jgi:putative membrane protein
MTAFDSPHPSHHGPMAPRPSPRLASALLAIVLGTLVWSGIAPIERYTWMLEIAPVVIGAPLAIVSFANFPLTRTLMLAIASYSVVLLIGGHYTYAAAPPGEWLRDALSLDRNHYDRFGHVLQGLVPALLGRELLLRKTDMRAGGWLLLVGTALGLGTSALYEILEWPAALGASALTGEGSQQFLEAQGDLFDTQKDMLLALAGALFGQLFLARFQDRDLRGGGPMPRMNSPR